MTLYGNRWKRMLGKTREEFISEDNGVSVEVRAAQFDSLYEPEGTAKAWTYYSSAGCVMSLHATATEAQSRNPKGEVFAVEVPA